MVSLLLRMFTLMLLQIFHIITQHWSQFCHVTCKSSSICWSAISSSFCFIVLYWIPKKLHIFTFYLFTFFQNNTVQTFGTNMFGRHWLNLCKDYVVIESSEKHVFLWAKSNVGRNWKSQSYQCALCYYSWWNAFLSHSSKVVNIGCEQPSYDVGWKLWTVWTWCNAWWRHSGLCVPFMD